MRISEAESAVMEVLWKSHPLAADEVLAALAETRQWQEPTVKTLLSRLLRKGAVNARKEGRRFLYSPVLAREAWVQDESAGMLERLFDGRVAPLVAHFSRHDKLSDKDIQELRALLEEMDDDER
ncbi:BlaI/MecI/CopY family transcriptional regulator [Lysobacter sp. SG-8]|uniref:BlaI/MecI/CopY family transcriptional regulator n=1 Tax=Marilutibacter penaei TaxID=2759900 RepID=A0A7W3U459_9GAMM|nr:BlaI/MecI/CopY family transcriptional regulator [Lysobacter penaei]MBB1088285.1 BlaI/MecI/CopY family transcriptional regulator [Lysobacter penaei]